MVTVLSRGQPERTFAAPGRAHRPDNEVLKKPDWIRVKQRLFRARLWRNARDIVRSNKLAGCSVKKPVCPEYRRALGKRSTRLSRLWTSKSARRACGLLQRLDPAFRMRLDPNEPEAIPAKAAKQMG